ncbi:MAG: TRAP transporter permease [Methylobacteriaceae bacterium]|nr:TRAP transporter permease [Methylobacteriaceae bacterium]
MTGATAAARITARAAALACLAMALYHLWVIVPPLDFISPKLREMFPGPPADYIFRSIHLLFALVVTFLLWRRSSLTEDEAAMRGVSIEANGRLPWPDLALLAAAAAPLVYVLWNYDYFVNRIIYIDDLKPLDMAMAALLVLVLLEATRRVLGWALPATAIVFLAYALLIARVEPMRLLDQLYMSTEGIFGQTLAVSATYVMIFVVFGAFMERTGTGQLFMDFALSLTGHTAGGPGKVSVVSSSLFGTISGSAVANVMVDGPITIPLMKRAGFQPHFAAAVEAVASTGGQIMPPIMGAAAFVMAEFMGVGYGQVIVWAILPAILYYVACFAAVHFEARRSGLHGVPRSELPRLGTTLRERGHLFLPVATILAVMWLGYSAPLAALASTLACFPVAALRASTRGAVTFANVVGALIDGAKNTVAVALACACAGIIIGVITLTGLGITFTQLVVGLSQNMLFPALLLTMIAGIILGMGMPTTPAYIIMTSLLVPALIKLGVIKPAAHMFAFYFAILSAITPPVALAVYASSSLAKSDLWKTGWAAMRVGAAGFIAPFMFVYQPTILMIGEWPEIAWTAVTATFGILLLAASLSGWWIAAATLWQRVVLLAGALALIWPGLWTDLAGFGAGALVAAAQWSDRRAARAAA